MPPSEESRRNPASPGLSGRVVQPLDIMAHWDVAVTPHLLQILYMVELSREAGIGGIKIMHAVETKSRERGRMFPLYFPCRCLCLGFFELERVFKSA
jgi:hypothetical protein